MQIWIRELIFLKNETEAFKIMEFQQIISAY